jgi:hypothetical protein
LGQSLRRIRQEEEGRRGTRTRRWWTNIWLGQSSIERQASVVCHSRHSHGLRDC